MSKTFQSGRALVIGVGEYKSLSALGPEPVNDAEELAKILVSANHCGYPRDNVQVLINADANRSAITNGLKRLAANARDSDTVIVYFSGHGAQRVSGPDIGTYLCPPEFDSYRPRETGIESEELSDLLKQIPAERLLVLIDACHSGAAARLKGSVEDVTKWVFGGPKLEALAVGKGRVIISASAANEESLILGIHRNSLFTHFLLEGLKGGVRDSSDGLIRVLDLFQYVAKQVQSARSTQHPELTTHTQDNFPVALRKGGRLKSERVASTIGFAYDPADLLKLGNAAINPKLVTPKSIDPVKLFTDLALSARKTGKRRIVVGWNVRPVQHLGVIHFAYLQQLSRLAGWGFKVKINIFDIFTTESLSPVLLESMINAFKRQVLGFRHIHSANIELVSQMLKKRNSADLMQELFRIARPSLGTTNNSANDPATSLDNLLCMAVEMWKGVDVLLAGGRDSNDYWAQYRSRLFERDRSGTGLSLVLDFPKLEFVGGNTLESLPMIPKRGDTVDQIGAKLYGLDANQLETIWNALLAPCEVFPSPKSWDPMQIAAEIHRCFESSPFLNDSSKYTYVHTP